MKSYCGKAFRVVAADGARVVNSTRIRVAAVIGKKVDKITGARDPGLRPAITGISISDDHAGKVDRGGVGVGALRQLAGACHDAVAPDESNLAIGVGR